MFEHLPVHGNKIGFREWWEAQIYTDKQMRRRHISSLYMNYAYLSFVIHYLPKLLLLVIFWGELWQVDRDTAKQINLPLYIELDFAFGCMVLLDWVLTSLCYNHSDGGRSFDCSFELCICKLLFYVIISFEFCVWGSTIFLMDDWTKVIADKHFGKFNEFLRSFLIYRICLVTL